MKVVDQVVAQDVAAGDLVGFGRFLPVQRVRSVVQDGRVVYVTSVRGDVRVERAGAFVKVWEH